jgi:hypothetical protein
MTKILRSVVVLAIFACTCASAQTPTQTNGNFVDLTAARSPAAPPSALKDPPTCPPDSGGGTGFGMPDAGDTAARKLRLEITKISNPRPHLDDDVTADVSVTNTGSNPVTIAWSADPHIVPVEPGATVRWSVGEIDVMLQSPKSTVTPESAARELYGIASKPESYTTLAPGDSATIRVGFKIRTMIDNDLYPVTPGKWKLGATFHQARRSLKSDECSYKSEWTFLNFTSEAGPIGIEIPEVVIAVKPPAPVRPAATSLRQLELHVTLDAGTDGIDFDSVISDVTRRVLRSAQLALSQQTNPSLKADFTARFTVMKDGTLAPGSVSFTSGSGDDAARDALLQSIRDAAPFHSLPIAFDRKSIAMRVSFLTGVKPK